MPLNSYSSQSTLGADGAHGLPGAPGTSSQRLGAAGSAGQVGGLARELITSQIFLGDAAADVISLERLAQGGAGGAGAAGGHGAASEFTSQWTQLEFGSIGLQMLDRPGHGGQGGAGGAGGAGDVAFSGLRFDLGGAQQGFNQLHLTGRAIGGRGNGSGSGGDGGSSGPDSYGFWANGPYWSLITQQASAGGLAGAGNRGGAGGSGSVRFTELTVTGDNLQVQLSGHASGGAGGSGAVGAAGGSGAVGQAGGQGGQGADGGLALAEVAALRLQTASGDLSLSIDLAAVGGQGGMGGDGGMGGYGTSINGKSIDGTSWREERRTHAAAGDGGDGGNGGSAGARLVESTLLGSTASDTVSVSLFAQGGGGGQGGQGSSAVASGSQTWLSPSEEFTLTSQGVPAGLAGRDGLTGQAWVEMRNNKVLLAEGDDTLSLSLLAVGPNRRLRVAGNVFDGGAGRDTLVLGNGSAGEEAVEIDVANQRLIIAGGSSSMLGFEVFTATSAADRIIDGGRHQEYWGGDGADQYTFTAGLAGRDVIWDFSAADRIVFAGFGKHFYTFAQVMAATTQTGDGALISHPKGQEVLLAGVSATSLTTAQFSFV